MIKTFNALVALMALTLVHTAPRAYGQLDAHDHSHGHAHTHAHTHDRGELLVMQQGNMWNMEFTIPAINAFGFEHKPESKQQKKLIQGFVDKVAKPETAIGLNGSCKLVSFEEQVSKLLEVEKKHHHHGHAHHKDEGESHIDANFSYLFDCKNAPSALNIKLFAQLKGLEQLSVQWVIEQGQGAKTVGADKPRLVLSP